MNTQEAREFITSLFQNRPLPQRPEGRMSKEEREVYQKSIRETQDANELFRLRRRRFMVGLGAAAGSLILATQAPGIAARLTPPFSETIEPVETYSGEIEETQTLIQKFNSEVGSDLNRFLRYSRRISNLATAFVSKQMSLEFPDLQDKYQMSTLKGRFSYYDPDEYNKLLKCPYESVKNDPASTDPNSGLISARPEALHRWLKNKDNITLTWFLVSVHELFHSTSPVRSSKDSLVVQNTTQLRGAPIDSIIGLRMFEDRPGVERTCQASWWWELEETVVEHATTQMVGRVGVKNTDSLYLPWIMAYQEQVINPLFQGRYQDLFKFQQLSDIDNYMITVGEKITGQTASSQSKIGVASQILVPLLDAKNLRR